MTQFIIEHQLILLRLLQSDCIQFHVILCYCVQTASTVSAELEETDSNASVLTTGDPEPPRKQFCFKNAIFEVIADSGDIIAGQGSFWNKFQNENVVDCLRAVSH